MAAYNTPALRWQATSAWEPAASIAFVYVVHTTRIFCRPTRCSSLVERENVSFYDTPADAKEAGFRACKRCWPMGGEGR